MKAMKRAFLILPLVFSLNAWGDEYPGSSGKIGTPASAPKARAVSSIPNAAGEVYVCDLIYKSMGDTFKSMWGASSSTSVLATPFRAIGEKTARAQCLDFKNNSDKYRSKTYKCSCGTLASARLTPTADEIAAVRKMYSPEPTALANNGQ